MAEKRKAHGWLVHLFVLSTLTNGTISDHVRFRSREMETSRGKWAENPGQVARALGGGGLNGSIHKGEALPGKGLEDEVLHWMLEEGVEKGGNSCEGRSLRFRLGERFAFRKRLQFALLPIMYKMGVMTTLLTGLTVLVLKGLTIGVILLIFAFGNYFTKLHKHSHHSAQPIHVHVHSQDGHKVSSFPSAVGPWDREADEVHPGAYLRDDDVESYRRRLIENSAAMVRFKTTL